MIEVNGLTKTFTSGVFRKRTIHAVKDVSFTIPKGTTMGLAGDSGCGKSTIARMLLKLTKPDSGDILLDGENICPISDKDFKPYRRKIQIVFQHPESSLDPCKQIRYSLLEPMEIHNLYSKEERLEKIQQLLRLVDVGEHLLTRYPHQISGGEAQRIMIARALTLSPEVLILDEPTSMLDVSIQAHIMTLLRDLQQQMGLTYLFISHDVDVLAWFCDNIAVMSQGSIIEYGSAKKIISEPQAEYTQKLIGSFRNW